jgi:hypothetical protein
MRMSIPAGLAACAIAVAAALISVVPPLSTPAFAAKQSTVLAACKRTKGCWSDNYGNGFVAGCSPKACFECVNGNCRRTAITATGGSKIQRGPNAVVTTGGPRARNVPIQIGPNAVITTAPTRPTGNQPCTGGHCGPLGGRKGR